ncbi:MAG: shikimate dehydrogenase [Parvicellaceae bacterium]|jgi:shikimate dehydrogenase
MSGSTYGLIGKKLGHSFSQAYFTKKFSELELHASYLNFELNSIEDFKETIKNNDLKGVNVTIPYKEEIIPFLDEIDPTAKEIGAVNTVTFKDGVLKGYNTDAFGFRQSIKPFFKGNHERALILGTGGASKAVIFVLKELGVDCLSASRNPQPGQISYPELNNYIIRSHQLIVNTTPLGMFPSIDTFPELPYEFITNQHLLVDLVYNPKETVFMKKGKTEGANTINGLTMLQQQAEKAWEIWNA